MSRAEAVSELVVPSSPNILTIRLDRQPVRALVDTGSELTLINKQVYDSMKNKPPLTKKHITLQSANGGELEVAGTAELQFKIQGMKYTHDFLVVGDLSRRVILGRDFLIKNNARIYFDLGGKIRLRNVYLDLENDVHLTAAVTTIKPVVLKPQTAYLITAIVRKNITIQKGEAYTFEPTSSGFIQNQPEIKILPSIDKIKNNKTHVQILTPLTPL